MGRSELPQITESARTTVFSVLLSIAPNARLEGLFSVTPSESLESRLARLRDTVPECAPAAALAESREGDVRLVDVREGDEVRAERIPGSLHLPRGFLELQVGAAVPDRSTSLLLYCRSGVRSLLAADTLRSLGYENVRSLAGGFERWKDEGLPVEQPLSLDDSDRARYARHLSIPEVGEEGQRKLLDAKVLLVGGGGLGCPAALYLAAAGVGTIGIIDFDKVDASNLQRQVLYRTDRVGNPKALAARDALLGLNPGIEVIGIEDRLSIDNVDEMVRGYDVVLDGADNFATRYLVNDAAVKHGFTCVHGSVFRFDGQVSVFRSSDGPCYRCLYPEPPPAGAAPSCAEAGVLGVLPGVIGLLMAIETIKAILGEGELLIGKLLTYDALSVEFRTLKVRKSPTCQVCSGDFPGYRAIDESCSA